ATGNLRQMFSGHFRIRLPAYAMIRQEAIQLGFIDDLPAHEVDRRLADDANVRGWIELGHGAPSVGAGLLDRYRLVGRGGLSNSQSMASSNLPQAASTLVSRLPLRIKRSTASKSRCKVRSRPSGRTCSRMCRYAVSAPTPALSGRWNSSPCAPHS